MTRRERESDAPDFLAAALQCLAEPEPSDPLYRITWARKIVDDAKRSVSLPLFFRKR